MTGPQETVEPHLTCQDCGGTRLALTHRFRALPGGGAQVHTTGDCTECGTTSETAIVASLSRLVIRGLPIDETEPTTVPRMLIARLLKRTGGPRNDSKGTGVTARQSPTAARLAAKAEPGKAIRRTSPSAHLRQPKSRD